MICKGRRHTVRSGGLKARKQGDNSRYSRDREVLVRDMATKINMVSKIARATTVEALKVMICNGRSCTVPSGRLKARVYCVEGDGIRRRFKRYPPRLDARREATNITLQVIYSCRGGLLTKAKEGIEMGGR
jgi:hypothetical protein